MIVTEATAEIQCEIGCRSRIRPSTKARKSRLILSRSDLSNQSCESGAFLHRLVAGGLGLCSLRESRRPSRCREDVRAERVPYGGGAQGADQHDDAWRHAVGSRALQQRCVSVQVSAFRRKLRRRRATAATYDVSGSDGRGDREERCVALTSIRCSVGRFRNREMCCACSNAADESAPEIGNPDFEEDPGKPEIKLSERGFGTELRTDPGISRPTKDSTARSAAFVSRNERSAGGLSRQRVQRMPRGLRE